MVDKQTVRQLPIVLPPIVSLLRWAYTLAIALQSESAKDWFYSNFIQLYRYSESFKADHHFFIDFWRGGLLELIGGNPFLLPRIIGYEPFSPLAHPEEIDEFIIEAIDRNFYATIFLDEAQLSFSPMYRDAETYEQSKVFAHHVLFYGYDKNEGMFDALGFGRGKGFGLRTGSFGHQRIPFSEVRDGVRSMNKAIENGRMHDQLSYLHISKATEGSFPHKFSLNVPLIIESIEDYLDCRTRTWLHNVDTKDYAFGLRVYDEVARYFDLVREQDIVYRRAEIRHIHTLVEHKQVMQQRLSFLSAKAVERGAVATVHALKPIAAGYDVVVKDLQSLKALIIVYLAKKNDSFFENAHKILARVRENEVRLLNELLEQLRVAQL